MSASGRIGRRRTRGPGAGLLLAVVLAAPAPLRAQAYGYLAGTVLDDLTGAPLARAAVTVVGSDLRAQTDEEGRFLLEGIPGGEPLDLRVAMEGYGSVVEPIEISPVEVGLVQVRLRPIAAVLDDLLVVTGGQRTDDRGAVALRPENDGWRSALDLLQDGVPGVQVARQPGQVGGGAGIRIRGVTSLQADVTPAVYVDGVRIEHDAARLLEEMPAETVARIRVLRGPAAASLYAFAANGVIVIETRRGGEGG